MGDSENSSRIEDWAQRIESAGLTPIAVSLLEVARALGLVASQTIIFGEPLLSGIINQNTLRETSEFLADPDRIDQLLARLETGTQMTGR